MSRSPISLSSPTASFAKQNSIYSSRSPSKPHILTAGFSTPKNSKEPNQLPFHGESPNHFKSLNSSPTKLYSTLPSFGRALFNNKSLSFSNKMNDAVLNQSKDSGASIGFLRENPRLISDPTRLDNLFRQDYTSLKPPRKQKNEDIEDVKRLDEWQMSMKKEKSFAGIIKPNELIEQHKLKHREVKERQDVPSLRHDIIDKIIADSDNEEDRKFYREKLPPILPESKMMMGGDSLETPNDGPKTGARSLEVMQRENNKEILSDLINKKIKEYVKSVDVNGMTEEQLRVHVKKVADGVVKQFEILKGPTGSFIVHNCVETTVKILRSKNQDIERLFVNYTKDNSNKDGPVVDYEMMEEMMMEKFELCAQDSEALANKIRDSTLESYHLKKELLVCQAQVDEAQRFYDSLGDPSDRDLKRSPSNKGFGRRRKSQVIDPAAVDQRIKIPMSRVEKQAEIIELTKQLNEAKEKLEYKHQEIQMREEEAENVRNQKDYYKMQLRDLYYKCLKDDVALLKDERNLMSYAWVIRAIWKINEEVKDSLFPSYLDPNSITFLIDYARAQNELEEFCKENNIYNLISGVDDFKCLNKTLELSSAPLPEQIEENIWPSGVLDRSPTRSKLKDLDEMIGDIRDQMANLKRVNLKAKRQIPVGKNPFKAKGVVYKWEEVDPNQIDRVITSQQDQSAASFTSIEGSRDRHVKKNDQGKIVWEQGMDKLRAILAARKKEIERLFKQNLPKDLDDRLRANLQKAFKFLFGKYGQETYSRFLREKIGFDQNAGGKAKKANLNASNMFTKMGTASTPGSPMTATSSQFPKILTMTSFAGPKNGLVPDTDMSSPMNRMSQIDFNVKSPTLQNMGETRNSWLTGSLDNAGDNIRNGQYFLKKSASIIESNYEK